MHLNVKLLSKSHMIPLTLITIIISVSLLIPIESKSANRKIKRKINETVSPQENNSPILESKLGFKCVSDCMKSKNGRYYWCHAADIGWDLCTPFSESEEFKEDPFELSFRIGTKSKNLTLTSRGLECKTPCAKREGTKYFWCSTVDPDSPSRGDIISPKHDWDYCSPTPNMDYYGRPCSDNCDYHGNNYKWCSVSGETWGYCS